MSSATWVHGRHPIMCTPPCLEHYKVILIKTCSNVSRDKTALVLSDSPEGTLPLAIASGRPGNRLALIPTANHFLQISSRTQGEIYQMSWGLSYLFAEMPQHLGKDVRERFCSRVK